MHREALLASESVVCCHCSRQFPPTEVMEWCDGEDLGQTAICPYCSVDAVVGWSGPLDLEWVTTMHNSAFGTGS